MEIIEGIHRVDEASGNMAHSNVYLVTSEKDMMVAEKNPVICSRRT